MILRHMLPTKKLQYHEITFVEFDGSFTTIVVSTHEFNNVLTIRTKLRNNPRYVNVYSYRVPSRFVSAKFAKTAKFVNKFNINS